VEVLRAVQEVIGRERPGPDVLGDRCAGVAGRGGGRRRGSFGDRCAFSGDGAILSRDTRMSGDFCGQVAFVAVQGVLGNATTSRYVAEGFSVQERFFNLLALGMAADEAGSWHLKISLRPAVYVSG